MLVPYCELNLEDENGQIPLSEIVIGPCPHMELSVASVEHLLRIANMSHVSVRKSDVPYRNW
jgi:hypothetical protein